jgi:hypothetical protein
MQNDSGKRKKEKDNGSHSKHRMNHWCQHREKQLSTMENSSRRECWYTGIFVFWKLDPLLS